MLIKFVRDKNCRPVGAIVAIDKVSVGWSKCNSHDNWDREKAIDIAAGRAEASNYKDVFYNIPRYMIEEIDVMKDRAKRYFR